MKKLLFTMLALVLAIGLALPMAMPVAADPGPGIRGLWHFDNNALDSSGNGNNGTLHNFSGTYWVADQWGGQALSFDGVNDYVGVNGSASMNLGNQSFTIELWFKTSATSFPPIPYNTGYLISNYHSTNEILRLALAGNDNCEIGAYTRDSNGSMIYLDSNTVGNDDEWHHVALVRDTVAHTIKLYVDGVEKASATDNRTGDFTARTGGSTEEQWRIGSEDRPAEPATTGYFPGLIDEVRIWDTATPSFNLTASPEEDFNLVGTDHTVTATVTINKVGGGTEPAPGVLVDFAVSGANTDTGSDYTRGNGEATFTYTGDYGGMDTITAEIDYDPYQYVSDTVTKYWFSNNFVTGGGNYKEGKTVAWTFGGNVGFLPDGTIVGQFEIVDHANKVSWHCHNDFSSLVFSGPPIVGPPGPSASSSIATFTGTFTSNKGGSATLTVIITDVAEPGAGADTIAISSGIGFPSGTQTISGGNFQVHNVEGVVYY